MQLRSVNPATEEVVERFPAISYRQASEIAQRCAQACGAWSGTGIEERAKLAAKLARQLLAKKQQYAEAITREMGKPITQALAEIEKCAVLADYYAAHGPGFLADAAVKTGYQQSRVSYEPLGAILCIMPWNFPFWQVLRCAIPALLAGNTVLLKHASNVPRCALDIEQAVEAAGFPDNVFRTLLLDADGALELIGHRAIAAVSFTGSTQAGMAVGQQAGRHLKKAVLELGGSDPFIVLEDADLKLASSRAIEARNANGGQSCIAAKRFIVAAKVEQAFTQEVQAIMARLQVGDPLDKQTQVGPLAKQSMVEDLDRQVKQSVQQGARLRHGGGRMKGKGFFYQPTLLAGVKPGMPVWDEETFGPVLPVMPSPNVAESIKLANDTQYGLGASVWTRDIKQATLLARQLQA
ncbi:MAG: aldehyde dehydrogenase family protein, partial [Candidatus Aenigmarchaeota archaeon]|nr:aldehyde dehydrogenase family protein [Candidatus Aenigmarchaeota archaeon]